MLPSIHYELSSQYYNTLSAVCQILCQISLGQICEKSSDTFMMILNWRATKNIRQLFLGIDVKLRVCYSYIEE